MARSAVLARNALSRVFSLLATLVRLAGGIVGAIILVYALFVLFGANPANPMVSFTQGVRESFGWFTENLFSTSTPRYGAAVNAAVAALIYVAAGNVVSKLILRLAPAAKA